MSVRVVAAAVVVGTLLVVPLAIRAAETAAANPKCVPWDKRCPCGGGIGSKCRGSGNTANCLPGICKDTVPGGKVNGICVAKGVCKGTDFTSQQGKQEGVGDAKGMMDALKGIMDMLKGKGGGGGGGGQPPQQEQGLEKGCASYYQVTAPSADPCAYYVPPTSDSLLNMSGLGISGSDALLDALNAEGESAALNLSDTLLGTLGGLPQETTETKTGTSSSGITSPPVGGNLSGQQVNLQSGTRGNIVVTEGGATIVAQARDAGANTEVAGFYGSDAYGGQPQGVIAGMCKNRPWAGSIVSFVIPPVFFDGLCAWRGYQVGAPAPPSTPLVERLTPKSTSAPAPTSSPQSTRPSVPPQVEIWAVPEKVPLGTRTSIFWNTKGVESCSIMSPEGSFNENSLSGGAATVPLTGATTFSISCLTPSGESITDYVTVGISI